MKWTDLLDRAYSYSYLGEERSVGLEGFSALRVGSDSSDIEGAACH